MPTYARIIIIIIIIIITTNAPQRHFTIINIAASQVATLHLTQVSSGKEIDGHFNISHTTNLFRVVFKGLRLHQSTGAVFLLTLSQPTTLFNFLSLM